VLPPRHPSRLAKFKSTKVEKVNLALYHPLSSRTRMRRHHEASQGVLDKYLDKNNIEKEGYGRAGRNAETGSLERDGSACRLLETGEKAAEPVVEAIAVRRLLGEILVESGLSPERIKKALDLQKKRGGRIGTLLMRLNFATEAEVLTALGAQLGLPFQPAIVEIDRELALNFPSPTPRKPSSFPFAGRTGPSSPRQRSRFSCPRWMTLPCCSARLSTSASHRPRRSSTI
jgi:hypothetical protein